MCDCDRGLLLLSARLDGALTTEEAAELTLHLAECPDCAATVSQLESLHDLMPELLEEVPTGFHHRVMARVAAERVVPFPSGHKRAWKTLLSTAAVLAVVIWGGGSLLHLGGADGGGPQDRMSGAPAPAAMAPEQSTYGSAGTASEGAAPDGTAPKDTPMAVAQTPSATQVDTPEMAAYGGVGGETVPNNLAPTVQDQRNGANTAPALTPAPEAGQSTTLPRSAVTPMAVLTETEAVEAVAAMEFPGATLTPLVDGAGSLTGLLIESVQAEPMELIHLGLSPNGSYYEFALEAQAAEVEQNRFAVALDGSSMVALHLTEADGTLTDNSEVYLAAVGAP